MLANIDSERVNISEADRARQRLGRSLSPRKIDRENLPYINKICANRQPLRFSWLSRSWKLKIYPIFKHELAFAELVQVDWGGAEVLLRLEPSLVEQAVAGVLQSDSLGTLTGDLRSLVIDAAFSDLSELIESRFRKRFRLVTTQDEASPEHPSFSLVRKTQLSHGWMLVLIEGAIEYRCEAWLDDLAFNFLADAIKSWPTNLGPAAFWSHLPITVNLCVGWTWLSLQTLDRINLNDVILLDECLVNQALDQVFIRMGANLAIKGDLDRSSIKITDWIGKIMNDIDDLNESNKNVDDIESAESEFDQIPVRLDFDLGQKTITFSELKSIGPGYVFELGRELRRAVTIRVNEKKIGEGELVDIDGTIGVAVLSINSPLP